MHTKESAYETWLKEELASVKSSYGHIKKANKGFVLNAQEENEQRVTWEDELYDAIYSVFPQIQRLHAFSVARDCKKDFYLEFEQDRQFFRFFIIDEKTKLYQRTKWAIDKKSYDKGEVSDDFSAFSSISTNHLYMIWQAFETFVFQQPSFRVRTVVGAYRNAEDKSTLQKRHDYLTEA